MSSPAECRLLRPVSAGRGPRIGRMRRESSTVVVLVGEVGDGLLAGLAQSPGVSVARAPAAGSAGQEAGEAAAARPGWETGALALRAAARHRSMYVIVPDDPLADVAAGWRAMWEVPGPGVVSAGAAGYERPAAEALAAWRDKRFELPDYYLVIAPARAARPARTCTWARCVPSARAGSRSAPRRTARPRCPRCWARSGPWSTAPGGRRWTRCSTPPATSTPGAWPRRSRSFASGPTPSGSTGRRRTRRRACSQPG